jgi:hypothetical protein
MLFLQKLTLPSIIWILESTPLILIGLSAGAMQLGSIILTDSVNPRFAELGFFLFVISVPLTRFYSKIYRGEDGVGVWRNSDNYLTP